MMRPFEPAYSQEAVEAMLAADSRKRTRARTLVLQLCRTPGREGDYQAVDRNGQVWEVALIDGMIVTYRTDHAVRELRIATIEWVE